MRIKMISIDVDDLGILYKTFYHLKGFIFRGQSSEKWNLSSKLDRIIRSASRSNYDKQQIELELLERCQKNANLYIDNPPENLDYFSWFSLIQHFGGSTRFIDFTYSPYIALFFALNSMTLEESSSVWCINKAKLWQKIVDYFELQYPDSWFGNFRYATTDLFNKKVFDNNAKRMNSVLVLDQKINHKRIANQQGLFLASLDNMSDFSDCIYNFLDIRETKRDSTKSMNIAELKEYSIIKFNINKKLYRHIAAELKMMNISSESLFPGLQGFIESFNFRIMYD
jgi:hypothetical protein